MFRLSPNNNIGESYRKFGLTDATSSLIAVKLSVKADGSIAEDVTNESVSKHLGDAVQGTSVELGEEGLELGASCDVELIRKMYKLGGDAGKKGKKGSVVNGTGGEQDKIKDMESVILGIIALKGS